MSFQVDLEQLYRELTDQGRVIEAGFVSLRLAAISPAASPAQLSEMRMAFFAGAQHLFRTVMTILEPGEEPTSKDLQRMDAIDKELRQFIAEFELRQLPTKGSS